MLPWDISWASGLRGSYIGDTTMERLWVRLTEGAVEIGLINCINSLLLLSLM